MPASSDDGDGWSGTGGGECCLSERDDSGSSVCVGAPLASRVWVHLLPLVCG